MKKLIILSLAVFSGLIFSDYANSETGIQIARARTTILSVRLNKGYRDRQVLVQVQVLL